MGKAVMMHPRSAQAPSKAPKEIEPKSVAAVARVQISPSEVGEDSVERALTKALRSAHLSESARRVAVHELVAVAGHLREMRKPAVAIAAWLTNEVHAILEDPDALELDTPA